MTEMQPPTISLPDALALTVRLLDTGLKSDIAPAAEIDPVNLIAVVEGTGNGVYVLNPAREAGKRKSQVKTEAARANARQPRPNAKGKKKPRKAKLPLA